MVGLKIIKRRDAEKSPKPVFWGKKCDERGFTVIITKARSLVWIRWCSHYRIVKWSVTESVLDRASIQTMNAAFEAVSAPEENCSTPLLKVEHSLSDRFLKRSESSLNTLSEQKLIFSNQKSVASCMTDMACVHTGNATELYGTISSPQQNINFCSHCTRATSQTEQKSIPYSVNIA